VAQVGRTLGYIPTPEQQQQQEQQEEAAELAAAAAAVESDRTSAASTEKSAKSPHALKKEGSSPHALKKEGSLKGSRRLFGGRHKHKHKEKNTWEWQPLMFSPPDDDKTFEVELRWSVGNAKGRFQTLGVWSVSVGSMATMDAGLHATLHTLAYAASIHHSFPAAHCHLT
jgi:hypothetical protein